MMFIRKKILYSFMLVSLILFIAYVINGKYFLRQYILSCNIGEKKIYDISYFSSGSSDLSLLQASKQKFKIEFKGKVKETCIENNNSNLIIQYDFKEAQAFVKNQEVSLSLNESHINTNLVLVTVSNIGLINEIHFSKYIDPTLSNIYRDYIANSFVDFTNKKDNENNWENEIENFSGKNFFHYAIQNARVTRSFIDRHTLENSYLYEETKNIEKKYSKDSLTLYTLASNNIPFSINMKRNTLIFLNNKQIGFEESSFTKKLQQTKSKDLASVKNNADILKSNEFYKTDLLARDIDDRLKEKMLLENFKYTNFSDFISNSNLEKKDNYTEYFLQLKSLFVLEPKSARDTVGFLIKINKMSDEFSLVLSALVSAGTIESQQALIETFYSLSDKKAKMVLIANLATCEKPALETESFTRSLWSENDIDLKSTAILALGNIGKNLHENDSQRKNKILTDIVNELQNTNDAHGQGVALLALGNLSDERALDNINAKLSSPKEDIRKAAAFSLRFINRSEPDNYLKNILQNDSSDTVKLAALEALSFRVQRADIVDLQKQILRNNSSEKIRMQTLKNLAQAGQKDEIRYAMQNDLSKSVRTYAENLLTRFDMNL
ncbi:HEAT repeat domain-containing protein [Fluviispira multicolorata]|nr:HEAT repeat domain-containing protein [Fluviispira multicolorata]